MRDYFLAAEALELKLGLKWCRLSLWPVHSISGKSVNQITIRNFDEAAAKKTSTARNCYKHNSCLRLKYAGCSAKAQLKISTQGASNA